MAQGKDDNLEAFGRRIISRLKRAGGNTDSLERLICRLMSGPEANPKIASYLACKVVEWTYGKAKETVEHQTGPDWDIGPSPAESLGVNGNGHRNIN